MLVSPNLSVDCANNFSREVVALALQNSLDAWQPKYPLVLIIDEPWGYAYERLSNYNQHVKVVLTSSPTPEYWQAVLTLEPNALLAGDQSLDEVIQALKLAKPHQILDLSPKTSRILTPTESKVLWYLATVKSNREIASILSIQEHTVANHLTSIFSKLEINSREKAML